MIVLVDGINGSGKTTLCKTLSERYGLPMHRTFRGNFSQAHMDKLDFAIELRERFAVPVNTYVDDLYVADFVAAMRIENLVSDRSMPSAIAYGLVNGQLRGIDECRLLEIWQEIYKSSHCFPDISYIWLDVDYEMSCLRLEDDKRLLAEIEYNRIQEGFGWVFRKIEFRKIRIKTGELGMDDVLELSKTFCQL